MKKLYLAVLSVILGTVLLLTACKNDTKQDEEAVFTSVEKTDTAQEEASRIITDSLNRNVAIPSSVNKVLPSGQLAQIFLLSACPGNMVAIASSWTQAQEPFLPEPVQSLPYVGQLYGGNKDFNLESVLAANPDIIIDVGEFKEGMTEDLDQLQMQLGIPVIHLDGALTKLPESFRLLGEILQDTHKTDMLANYCDSKNNELASVSAKIDDKINALLVTDKTALHVIANGSAQSESFEMFANNLAVIESPSKKGTGNEVDMEQILNWNPDYILYLGETVDQDAFMQGAYPDVKAIRDGHCYRIPFGPYNWLGFPSSIQKYLGMMWMIDTFYPGEADMPLYEAASEYFRLFYNYDLSKETFEKLIAQ